MSYLKNQFTLEGTNLNVDNMIAQLEKTRKESVKPSTSKIQSGN